MNADDAIYMAGYVWDASGIPAVNRRLAPGPDHDTEATLAEASPRPHIQWRCSFNFQMAIQQERYEPDRT
jgi:hypothetical protein